MPVSVPCGQCIGCRLERSRQWAVRCMHESKLHEENCFITLTYDNEHLPKHGSLNLDDFQKFMKRLRKHFYPKKIRFFHCGEYGEKKGRPHYHACLFGVDFNDKNLYNTTEGKTYKSSDTLSKLWPFGKHVIGDVTFESAAYVARYITKKVTGEKALEHYTDIDMTTGEVLAERKPEYVTMSRKKGIGYNWYKKFKDDVFPSDEMIVRGKITKPPKYYDGLFEIDCPEQARKIKIDRQEKAKKRQAENTPARLSVREFVTEAKFKQKQRSYENG